MSKLYAVATTEQKSAQQEAREAVKRYRRQPRAAASSGGMIIGERYDHRGWDPEVTLAFLNAFVIRPEKGEIARRLGYKS